MAGVVRRWLRPKGLLLLGAVLVLLAGGWWLLADAVVRRAVEGTGTALVGARVDLARAEVGLFPPRVVLDGLEVTDPDAPMTNAVAVDHGELRLDGGALLGARFVVDTARLDGVRLHTPRARSGALARRPKDEREGGFALPSIDLPDAGEILKDHPLKSVAAGDALARDLKAARAAWEARIEALPGPDRVEDYRARLKALQGARKGGLEGALRTAKDLKSLTRDVEADLKTLRGAGDDLKGDVADYRRRVQEVAAGPAAEARELARRYAEGGAFGMGAAFLNETAERWSRTALAWYRRLDPLVSRAARAAGKARVERPARGRGVDVRFPEARPLPTFLVREAAVGVTLPGGTVTGTIRDATPDPAVLGRPLTFAFAGDDLKGLDAVRLEGALDRVDPARPDDRVDLRLKGVRVKDLALARGGALPVTLAAATADLAVTGGRRGDALDVKAKADLSGARFEAGGEGKAAEAVGEALAGVRRTRIEADLTGTPRAPKVAVRSDLDRVLAGAMRTLAQDRVKALEADLTAAISQRLDARLADARASLDALEGRAGPLAERRQDLNGLLADAVDAARPRLPF